MSGEDREFEMARRFVRLAGSAARQVVQAQPGVDPQTAGAKAVAAAARQHVPGFQMGLAERVPRGSAGPPAAPMHSGRWIHTDFVYIRWHEALPASANYRCIAGLFLLLS